MSIPVRDACDELMTIMLCSMELIAMLNGVDNCERTSMRERGEGGDNAGYHDRNY